MQWYKCTCENNGAILGKSFLPCNWVEEILEESGVMMIFACDFVGVHDEVLVAWSSDWVVANDCAEVMVCDGDVTATGIELHERKLEWQVVLVLMKCEMKEKTYCMGRGNEKEGNIFLFTRNNISVKRSMFVAAHVTKSMCMLLWDWDFVGHCRK